MSHSRQTEHYELPLYDGNDIINPLTDFNNANSSIDEALYNANQRSVGAETTANEAKDIAEGYDTRVSQAIQTADDAMTLANNTQDMIADDFDANKEGGYNVGDFVIYNGKLYRFINAHTGAWDASDVQVSPVLIDAIADVVDEGKQAIADAVDEAEQEIAGQTEKVTKTQAMIAQPFDANKSGGYAVGDIVTYADKLYKFTSVHSGAWTGLDVEQVDVIKEVDAVDERVDELNSALKFYSYETGELSGGADDTRTIPAGFDKDKVLVYVYRKIGDGWYRNDPVTDPYAIDMNANNEIIIANRGNNPRNFKVNLYQIN
jgi:hypothetical protein